MKTISAELQAHLASENVTLATCWKLTRTDSVVMGFTDHDRDLVVGAVTYVAATGFTDVEIGSMIASQFWTGQLYQVATFNVSGAFPNISDVYDGANIWPKDITTLPGIFSIANCDLFNVAKDAFLADWTINNTPTTSTTIPVI